MESKADQAPSSDEKKPGRSNLTVRLLTVAVLGPLLLSVLFFAPAWAWALLLCVSAALASRELLAMTHPDDGVSISVGALASGLLAAAVYFSDKEPRLFLTGLVVVTLTSALLPLLRFRGIANAALKTTGGIAAPVYVGVLLVCLALLRRDQGDDGPAFVFLTLTIAWMGDTGGYTFGRLFGKTKLYEAVSPKKTREGLLGSIVFSTGSAVLASLTYLPKLPLTGAVGLGVFGAILGQMGDLVESLMKRSTGVKDSGNLLPGHGGLLDRIDALLVVSPFVYLYTLWAL